MSKEPTLAVSLLGSNARSAVESVTVFGTAPVPPCAFGRIPFHDQCLQGKMELQLLKPKHEEDAN